MRLTRGADYGARSAIYLAKQDPSAIVLVSEIAAAEALSASYLAKIMQDMAKEGIVRSHRGAKGGFSLARPPAEITLRQVIEAIEGPISLARCLVPWEGCEKQGNCALHPVLETTQATLLAQLDTTTLADLAHAELAQQEPST